MLNTAIEAENNETFYDLFIRSINYHLGNTTSNTCPSEYDDLEKIAIYSTQTKKDKIEISDKGMGLNVCDDFKCRYVEFTLHDSDGSVLKSYGTTNQCRNNAFSILMKSNATKSLPAKPEDHIKGKLTGPQRLKGDVMDWTSGFDDGWYRDQQGTGETVMGKLSNALWAIDHCQEKLEQNGCVLPTVFKQFSGYNQFTKLRHKAPLLTQEKLEVICADLSKCLSFPSMSTQSHKKLATHIEALLACLTKYKSRLADDNFRHKTVYQVRQEPARTVSEDSTSQFIAPKPAVDEQFSKLDDHVCKLKHYEVVDLENFSPCDKEKRRKYIKDLRLSVPIMLFRMSYGGSIGTLNFVWSVPIDDSPERCTGNSNAISKITELLPKFSTRSMRRDFINKYSQYVKTPKSILRHMYHELTQTETVSETDAQRQVDERIADILLTGDDPELLLDYRALNGKDVDTHFGEFFAAMGDYFDKQLLQVHDRRHGNELYLPLAISVEDLKEQVVKDLPDGVPIPSSETIRLQFTPGNPFQRTALKYTSRFNVKFRVQTRMARVHHKDGRYVATLFRYLKEFCVRYRGCTTFICLDDKAVVPVGEPGVPISTGVRGHNKVMAPATDVSLVAADHDFHIAGLVPSVTLVTDIPKNPNDSFFQGHVYVTTKDKVFEASSPFRHASEVTRILRDHHSDDQIDLATPILCIMTDGGPDHRVTYETVKTSLLEMFMQLDLDMLVAIRTAPNHSWTNPAERCMSILNLALQHTALERKEMPKKYEDLIKHKSSLNAIRNVAVNKADLKTAFTESMSPVIEKVNDRFSRMKLKGSAFTVYRGYPKEDVEDSLRIIRDCTLEDFSKLNTSSTSKDLRNCINLQEFIKTHGVSTHYSFQLMKCREEPCRYCMINPIRVDRDTLGDLSFLPCPVRDESGQHYLPFHAVYGKDVDETHRPSAQNSTDFDDSSVEMDRRNREILKAGKARDIIICGECSKPRVVYSGNKMSREQDAHLRRIKEAGTFTCGENFPEEFGFIIRKCLHCTTEVEVAYYSASMRAFVPSCCLYCGTQDENELLGDSDPYIENLMEQFSSVRPICKTCREKGLEAKTWGRQFVKKRKV
ncbi:uncharacterized protein LOC117320173 [Pecten maximus]|uniref:uncharacterized protein LOC117320173 n=1 Tax=Pecten maximus TaxID=6579 RepID=UPI0014586950|nr:uncharacterized protein LOC117320173 [Pecten maximus]